MNYRIVVNKEITAPEYSALMQSVGWGSNYAEEMIQRSLMAYPFIAHARSESGELCGYISAFSDRAFSTMLGELVVHPAAHRHGIGRALLSAVESEFSGIPIYVNLIGEAIHFFAACGYRAPNAEMHVLFKKNAVMSQDKLV